MTTIPAREALRSFMPVDWLARRRDTEALQYKFLSHIGRPSDRFEALSDWTPNEESTDFEPDTYKDFKGISIEYSRRPPAHAIDRATGLELKKRKRIGNLLL